MTLLSGGVGGAKLVLGMAQSIPPSELSVIVNTADDAIFHGLHVSPDLDTTMYTLAGVSNPRTGWGVMKDTFHALSSLRRYGEETWFRLGDQDLGTHILRTKLLGQGKTLTEITSLFSRKLGIGAKILPMTDEKVEAMVKLGEEWVPFQEYFVLKKGKGHVNGVRFKGIRNAKPTAQVVEGLTNASLIVLAPSNPVVSILPILSLPEFKGMLKRATARKVAVSPFIRNRAVSGPAKELIEAMGYEGSSVGLAKFYLGLIDLLVIDEQDAQRRKEIEALGIRVVVTSTIMNTLADKTALAQEILKIKR